MSAMNVIKAKTISITLIFTLLFSISNHVLAWSERGHDVITRVAVQHMQELSGNNANLMRPFLSRDHMLSHLSNVPEIVWGADYMSDEAKQSNAPTHYIALEKVGLSDLVNGIQDWSKVPLEFESFQALCDENGVSPETVGTAPWRILQLYKLMVEELIGLDNKPKELQTHHINQALNYAGLMSHFVADLANPHHTTENSDGQLDGHAGLYNYFATSVISELSFKLPSKVRRKASKSRLWLKGYKAKQREEIRNNPQKLVWALIANSHANIERLTKLDKRYSLIEKSQINSASLPAKRKAASQAAQRYERFVVQRFAISADVLARLWQLAWQDAGAPNMSNFKSDYYPIQPPFVTPSY